MSSTELQSLKEFKDTLRQYMYENYAGTLIDQLFSIIIDYPESEPAILDLKNCLMKTDLRSHLVISLKDALENRLLHPGVNTSNILAAYISAIRALRVLDPAGVILELVCEPVQKYLRDRDNTVRCIVSSLTEEGVNELSDELIRGLPHIVDDNAASDDEDWNKWIPDPVDADPTSMSKVRRTSDIISMLVNIYGSKELFVNEYRNLLADRILSQFNYDTEREIRYLELLKLRFGESQLHYCEVMLKDVTDSRRINAIIKEDKKKDEPEENADDIEINAMILSAQCWPTFREEKLNLPENMQTCLENYTKKFESRKGNRTLIWKPHLGLVNIDIELKERVLNLNVSPVHAAIIMQFQNKDQWTVEELSSVLQIPATALRRKIAYWQSQGLLKEEATDTFLLVEEQRANSDDIMLADEEETESAMASMRAQMEEQMQVFWTYIVGMLTNLESLPIERIHSMLRMFAVQGPSSVECSLAELKAFLDKKVKDQKLIYTSGVYRLSHS
ncbi:anaphase-promoting complex subunit 2-like [Octopus vulgaris]|uniref:Anaphase-promoting complex subunit 2 n=2 Tax=Octopus TaxID=6643 RepID=A0AA36FGH4_OCTVU|nr:anaphase-promoting complex subunit 2-like [Octopus vulgaris]